MKQILSLQKNLVHIAAALGVYGFASSLVGVFIPLVILQSGGALWEVPAFYLFYAACKLCLNYPVILLLQRRGAVTGLSLGFVAGALQMLSIWVYSSTHTTSLLLASGLAMAATNACLWNSQHLFISRAMQEGSKSSSIATITIIGQVGGVLAPLVGGLVGAYLGTGWLLGMALVLCAVAAVPLRHMRTMQTEVAKATTPIVYNLSGAPLRDVVANFCFNIETAVGVMVWPIYLAVFVAAYKPIGFISALAAVVAFVVTWLAGRRGDRGKDQAVLREGVAVSSVIDIVRIMATTQVWIAAVSTAYKASLAYFQNAWVSVYYHHAKRDGLQYIMSMEIACDLAYIVLWGVLFAVARGSTDHNLFFVVAFVLAAFAGWGCLLITPQGELTTEVAVDQGSIV